MAKTIKSKFKLHFSSIGYHFNKREITDILDWKGERNLFITIFIVGKLFTTENETQKNFSNLIDLICMRRIPVEQIYMKEISCVYVYDASDKTWKIWIRRHLCGER